MGLLLALPRHERCIGFSRRSRRGRYLQDSRQEQESCSANDAAIHTKYWSRELVEGLPNTRRGEELFFFWRLQHGAMPLAWRQGDVHQQPQRLQTAQTAPTHSATVRDG